MLKPCPFCNGVPELSQYNQRDDQIILNEIECTNCHVSGDIYDKKDEAIEAWNMRDGR